MLGRGSKHVFISYEHEDRETAAAIERNLNAAGFEVWWDERLQAGQKWAQEIDQALLNATAVIVLWSKQAILSEWVQHEASIAKIRNVLTHVLIDDVSVPEIFGSIQCSNLSTWDGSGDNPDFLRLVEGIKSTQWRNKVRKWLQTGVVSIITLIVAAALIGGTFAFQYYMAGPGQKTVTKWKVSIDHVEIKLDLEQLRQFYSPQKWDVAFICRESTGEGKTIGPNSSFAVVPIDEVNKKHSYKIKFQPDMSEKLMLTSSVSCDISVINKNPTLRSHTPLTEDGYDSFKWSEDIAGKGSHLEDMVNEFKEDHFAYIFEDVCACVSEYKVFGSEPP
ncbi:MAG: toll/interleukin-1 receptor domain-containing protein [Pseudomonadota bacterium]|nr:toll/interleukin-1 receptor domain-containing protein [Pseudomonadota bacterium]